MLDKKLKAQVQKQIIDPDGRFLILVVKLQGKEYILANICAPNNDDELFFTQCTQEIDQLGIDFKIIADDFNFVLDLELDKKGGLDKTHTDSVSFMKGYINQHKLIDLWRQMHPEAFRFTWKRLRPTPIFVRLDYIFISELIYQSVTDADILPGYQTDHSMPILNIDFQPSTRGPGYWKFNTSS